MIKIDLAPLSHTNKNETMHKIQKNYSQKAQEKLLLGITNLQVCNTAYNITEGNNKLAHSIFTLLIRTRARGC